MSTYVTSDIHGKEECLYKLLDAVGFCDKDELHIIGDVIDRNGDGGVGLLKWMLLQSNVYLILGNHENFMLDNTWIFEQISNDSLDELATENMMRLANWQYNGGEVTIKHLARESIETRAAIVDYVSDCPLYEDITVSGQRYLLVHGGLGNFHPEKGIEDYTPREILWTRPGLDTVYSPSEYTVILGHTPTFRYGEKFNNRMIKSEGGWWNIDTGAARDSGRPMLLCLDTLKEYYVEDNGEVAYK